MQGDEHPSSSLNAVFSTFVSGICYCRKRVGSTVNIYIYTHEGRTESHEQTFCACKPGTADEGEYGG